VCVYTVGTRADIYAAAAPRPEWNRNHCSMLTKMDTAHISLIEKTEGGI
jgi:hypothetical protein